MSYNTNTSSLVFFSLPISFFNKVRSFSLSSSWISSCWISSLRKCTSGPVPWVRWTGNKMQSKAHQENYLAAMWNPLPRSCGHYEILHLKKNLLEKYHYWNCMKFLKWKITNWNKKEWLWAWMELALIFLWCGLKGPSQPILLKLDFTLWLAKARVAWGVNHSQTSSSWYLQRLQIKIKMWSLINNIHTV